jgi:hypothetical protein
LSGSAFFFALFYCRIPKYGFGVSSAAELFAKAQADARRFSEWRLSGAPQSYALIDYIQTAWQLADWIAAETGGDKRYIRDEIDALCPDKFKLLGELANGQKHWHRTEHTKVPETKELNAGRYSWTLQVARSTFTGELHSPWF